ncbi:hypothetical protein DPMN_009587 [Dreissena polymorpha]|uniref:Uncharacterized protein n=1 Tax=Dreissena polymorpha TaxID=45954 RepID=A0A9D4MX80_DREPO|nr:hypothetical protein DPMN_009587 [Dreissena polymorpha]
MSLSLKQTSQSVVMFVEFGCTIFVHRLLTPILKLLICGHVENAQNNDGQY